MNLLITGGAGFIGSHLVDRLLDDGHDVTAIDNFDSFYSPAIKESNIAGHHRHPRYSLVRGDIREMDILARLPAAAFDAIVHLAARAGVRPSIKDPLLYQDVNVRGTQNLLEFARARNVPHFVFASSSSVYGTSPSFPWKEDQPSLRPISPYASTKVSGELMGHVYAHLFGIRFIGLRFFTVYGPRQRPDLAIHKFTRLIMAGTPLPFHGNGSTSRDYTHVHDIVAGIRSAINFTDSPYEIINLGNDKPVTLRALVAEIEQATGKRATLDRLPDQPGDVPHTCADITKARRLLGYAPSTPLKDGIAEFVNWIRDTDAADRAPVTREPSAPQP